MLLMFDLSFLPQTDPMKNIHIRSFEWPRSEHYRHLLLFIIPDNLDVEGNELNVLKSLNFRKYNPKLICVEIHNYTNISKKKKNTFKNNTTYKFLYKKKYRIIWNNGFSYIFKKV